MSSKNCDSKEDERKYNDDRDYYNEEFQTKEEILKAEPEHLLGNDSLTYYHRK